MIATALGRTFDWTGKANRREAWLFALFCLLLCGLALGVDAWLNGNHIFLPRLVYVMAGCLVPSAVAVLIRRAHDAGLSGRWLLLGLVPVLAVALIAWLLIAPGQNRRRTATDSAVLLAGGGLLVATLSLGVMLRAVWMPCWITTADMAPTLLAGDYILATRPPHYHPERGDNIVFANASAATRGGYSVLRVVGLPGDRVQMQNGILFLNGTAVPETPAGRYAEVFAAQGPLGVLPLCANAPVGLGATCLNDRLRETLPNGQSYDILNTGRTDADNSPEFTVPEGQYFVMGDNRDNSNDSRLAPSAGGAGMVPLGRIAGRADRVILSAAGARALYVWQWRMDRFLRAVR